MRIGAVNNVNFGKFERQSAQWLLKNAPNADKQRAYTELIIKESFNDLYDIKRTGDSWEVSKAGRSVFCETFLKEPVYCKTVEMAVAAAESFLESTKKYIQAYARTENAAYIVSAFTRKNDCDY